MQLGSSCSSSSSLCCSCSVLLLLVLTAQTRTSVRISEELVEEMQSLARQLLGQRKKRKPVGFVPAAAAAKFACSLSLPLHSAAARGVFKVAADTNPARHAAVFESSSSSSSSGGEKGGDGAAAEGSAAAAAAAAAGEGEGKVISVSSGADGAVVFFNLLQQKQIEKIQAHAKACKTFLLHPTEPLLVTGSDDKTVKIWRGSSDFSSSYSLGVTLRRQRGEIGGLALHPLNNYFAAVSSDRTWAFISFQEGRYLGVYRDLACQYASLAFHPDGMIMGGGGVDGSVYIWDMKGQQQRAALQGHTERINKLTFSENGYYLATASADGTVRLWDLRKSASFQTLDLNEDKEKEKEKERVMSAVFDNSGLYLAACTSSGVVKLYNFESRAHATAVATLRGHTDAVMDCAFVEGEKMLLTASMDKTVKVWKVGEDN
ncbi:WD-40 repeat protein, putative [Eimeria brunetti]|uniref:Pre-mRNA-processing factor 19 n=1 Tax=Eimeria brunetti TaxID=51314 RepID=U6LR77_9EIME|nr:WD-40 repeat protein, putative [Eimeria brunetti]